jgi:membrane-associated phospholipid phosphatase
MRRALIVLLVWSGLSHSTPARAASTSRVAGEVAVSAALIGGAFALDHLVTPGWEDEGPQIAVEEPGEVSGSGSFLFAGTAALAVGGLVFHKPEALATAKDLGIALVATSAAVWALKVATQRERPDGSNAYSFPSGHTATAFAAATVLDRRYGGIVGWAAYGAAAMAGEARIADNHHYLSDVVAGAILGRVIGRYVTRN